MTIRRMVFLALLGGALCMAGAGRAQTAAPRGFEAVAVSPTEIRLVWLPAEGATGYRVVRDNQPVADLPADAREYTDRNLPPDSTHRYALYAVQGDSLSPAREYIERTFAPFPETGPKSFDVVVVQASSSGVPAAIEAAKRGRKVALLEPTTRVGGMPVNGLCATDLRRAQYASGFLVRFAQRVRALYAAEGIQTDGLKYEPRIAHQAMKSLLYETPNLTLYRRVRLAKVRTQPTGKTEADGKARQKVAAVEVEELDAEGRPTGRRAEFRAGVFIDSTDSGDLAAWAGAPFRIGRERRTPDEPHNGVIYYDRARDAYLPGSTGAADRRIQSYAYLLMVKDYGPGVDKTIPRPPGYRRENYSRSPKWKDSWAASSGKLPNDKYELNQHPQGGDLQEINYGYPTGSYAERARVERLYRDHVLGYLYYIQTELGQKSLGLPDDEYRDTGGFPPLLYVREGRRILGEQLPQENEIANARRLVRPESVGLGDYPMDSHAVRVKTDWESPDMGEGEWWLYQYTPWHPLPFGVLVPQRLDNVFVTTAVSSTHVSYGTYRMEPARMQFGQAAGVAATLCLRYGLTAREVPARQVQADLLAGPFNPQGDPNLILYYLADVKPDHRHFRAIQAMTTRGFLVSAEELRPDAPTTRGELAHWLALLAERAAPEESAIETVPAAGERFRRVPFPAYMGWPLDKAVTRVLQQEPEQTAPVTRAEFARLVVAMYRAFPMLRSPVRSRYADISEAAVVVAADALTTLGVSATLWDGLAAHAVDGSLRFRPDAPLTHAETFAALYVLQQRLGPLFNDPPVDGRNGRAVPTIPCIRQSLPADK